jgi:hypothetical protein
MLAGASSPENHSWLKACMTRSAIGTPGQQKNPPDPDDEPKSRRSLSGSLVVVDGRVKGWYCSRCVLEGSGD